MVLFEVKNSILLKFSGTSLQLLGDSILGMGVNAGAGVKLSNVRNDRRRWQSNWRMEREVAILKTRGVDRH